MTFDLKGSTHGRKSKGEVKPSTIQKDLDLVEMRKREKKLFEMSNLNRKLERVLLQDTRFLQKHGFLDYSLLVAIEKSDVKFNAMIAMQSKRLTRGLVRLSHNSGFRGLLSQSNKFGNLNENPTQAELRQKTLDKLLSVQKRKF